MAVSGWLLAVSCWPKANSQMPIAKSLPFGSRKKKREPLPCSLSADSWQTLKSWLILRNVNFPENEVKGMALGGLYYRHDQNYFSKDEKGFWALRHTQTNFDDDKETDCYQVTHGIVSIVPLNRTYYQKGMKEKLQSKLK